MRYILQLLISIGKISEFTYLAAKENSLGNTKLSHGPAHSQDISCSMVHHRSFHSVLLFVFRYQLLGLLS